MQVNGKVLVGMHPLNASEHIRDACESDYIEILVLRRFQTVCKTKKFHIKLFIRFFLIWNNTHFIKVWKYILIAITSVNFQATVTVTDVDRGLPSQKETTLNGKIEHGDRRSSKDECIQVETLSSITSTPTEGEKVERVRIVMAIRRYHFFMVLSVLNANFLIFWKIPILFDFTEYDFE